MSLIQNKSIQAYIFAVVLTITAIGGCGPRILSKEQLTNEVRSLLVNYARKYATDYLGWGKSEDAGEVTATNIILVEEGKRTYKGTATVTYITVLDIFDDAFPEGDPARYRKKFTQEESVGFRVTYDNENILIEFSK